MQGYRALHAINKHKIILIKTFEKIKLNPAFEYFYQFFEWLRSTLPRPPTFSYNCREYRKWWFVEEKNMELALCAGCLVCVPRRAGVRVCSEREVDKEIKRDFSIICF